MWTLLVVFDSPASNFATCIPQVPEPTRSKAFVTKSAVKAFDMRVLCGPSRLNVNRANTSLHAQGEIVPAAYLRAVIRTKELRCTALIDDSLQHSCHALTRHAYISLERETFAREGVHNAENTQTSAARRHITGEINRPFLIRCGERWRRGVGACQSLASDAPNSKAGGAVHALHAFVVDALTRASQQNMKPPIAEAGLLVR